MRHHSAGDSLQPAQGRRLTRFSNLIIVILWVCQRHGSVAVTEAGRKEAFNFGCQSQKHNESHWVQSGSVRWSAFDGRVGTVLCSYFLSLCLWHTNTYHDKQVKYAFPISIVTSCLNFPCILADSAQPSTGSVCYVGFISFLRLDTPCTHRAFHFKKVDQLNNRSACTNNPGCIEATGYSVGGRAPLILSKFKPNWWIAKGLCSGVWGVMGYGCFLCAECDRYVSIRK